MGIFERMPEDFLAALEAYGIVTAVDVRSFPTSRRHVHFKREALNNIDLSNLWWNTLLGRPRPTPETNPIGWLPFWLVREWLGRPG